MNRSTTTAAGNAAGKAMPVKAIKAVAPGNIKKKKKSKEKAKSKRGEHIIDDGGDENDPTNLESNEASRKTFTRGWMQSFDVTESLPIKRADGKVVHIKRAISTVVEEDEDDESVEEDGDGGGDPEPFESDSEAMLFDDDYDSELAQPIADHTAAKNAPADAAAGAKATSSSGASNKKSHGSKTLTPAQRLKIRGILSTICMQITSEPEESLKKKKKNVEGGADDRESYGMKDLFEYMERSEDAEVAEMAMLSALLVFKDIAPGYRIRQQSDDSDSSSGGKDVKLKKETQRIRDFELSLLAAYQRYLRHLETKVKEGLGNPKRTVMEWTPTARLGLSALRCQCELLRWLPHFNFRTTLLNAVVIRAAQRSYADSAMSAADSSPVSRLCTGALMQSFSTDGSATGGELTYEAVRAVAKVLVAFKYDVPPDLVRCLQTATARITVHADDAKDVRLRAKKDRRKRRRSQDDVETSLMEASATSDKNARQRYQVDTLQEVALIYFRIVKQKVGFALLPAALEGLGSITHLINIDMVADLLPVLRALVAPHRDGAVVPVEVRLLCVHCVLKTLLGPGEALQADDEAFVVALRELLAEAPLTNTNTHASSGGDYAPLWEKLLECVEMLLLKRRESRAGLVAAIVHRLLLCACHLHPPTLAATALCLAHAVMLRYPKVRSNCRVYRAQQRPASAAGGSLGDVGAIIVEEDDVVEDLAMKALRQAAPGPNGSSSQSSSLSMTLNSSDDSVAMDASRLLPLLRSSLDARTRRIVQCMLAVSEVLPLPYRLQEARGESNDSPQQALSNSAAAMAAAESAVKAFAAVPAKMPSIKFGGNTHPGDVAIKHAKQQALKATADPVGNDKNKNGQIAKSGLAGLIAVVPATPGSIGSIGTYASGVFFQETVLTRKAGINPQEVSSALRAHWR